MTPFFPFRKVALCVLGAWAVAACADDGLVEAGRRIYQEGILPDGSPLTATHSQGSEAKGTEAACVNCHRPGGYGSMEGRFLIPPIAGAVLFAPGPFAGSGKDALHRRSESVERFRTRSAYDENRLARTLRQGTDADGVPLNPLMPHFRLDEKAVSALAAYLRHLSQEPVAGVEPGVLHLGTVVTPDASPERREAVLSVLRAFADEQKKWGTAWRLHVWQLRGPPQKWEAQLKDFYRQQPVFALLSGAGGAEWGPVQRFCESQAVACILPSVDVVPEVGDDYYSVYFSPGISLEAKLLAYHLNAGPDASRHLIQVVGDGIGRRGASALKEALAGSGIATEELGPKEYAARASRLTETDAVVFWLQPEELSPLFAKNPPTGEVFLSSMLAPPEELPPPPRWKAKLRYLSVFDPQAALRSRVILLPWLGRQGLSADELRVRADAYGACNFFNMALSEVQKQTTRGIAGPTTRERVLDTLEGVLTTYRDNGAPFYWQLSLGPGQRVPVRGGEILRYRGDELVAEERVVP